MISKEESFRAAIEKLGDTAEQISAILRSMSVVGYPGKNCNCPIANYLHKLGFDYVLITSQYARLYERFYIDMGIVRISLNNAIGRWIIDFDSGKYTEFIDPKFSQAGP